MTRHRIPTCAAALIVAAGALTVGWASPVSAVACTSPVRYASSSNTIYLTTPQAFTLSAIQAACPAAPLVEVDPTTRTWELRADLILQNGATLVLHGSASASPGDVNTLRMRSLASNLPTEVSQLTAQWGTIDADHVHVLSWDDGTAAADTNPYLPAGSATTSRGRAFVRALSYLDPGGAARTSVLNITNSEFDHLGYYAAESYGVAYKTRGCDHTPAGLPVCAAATVTGSQRNSHFHDNFMGTYAWGAKNIAFTGNEYDHNYMYGLDPHDVSKNLDIIGNHFHDNGDHGVICSQRCDHLRIEGNESDHNGMVPFTGPNPDIAGPPGQVHGIMIHRGVTNTTIANNNVHDQPNGAGIAVFDSAGDVISGNTLQRNEYGVRLSVGSAGNTITGNTISSSGQYAVYMYKGSDAPAYTTANGHPTGNTISSSTISGTGSNVIKLSEADRNTFTGNSVSSSGGSLSFALSTGNMLTGNILPSAQQTSVTGSAAEPGDLLITEPTAPTSISVDSASSATFSSSASDLFAVTGKTVLTRLSTSGSSLRLTSSLVGTAANIVVPQPVSVAISRGTATGKATGTGSSKVHVLVTVNVPATSISIVVGGLSAGSTYAIARNGVKLTTVTADARGAVRFTDHPSAGVAFDYSVARG